MLEIRQSAVNTLLKQRNIQRLGKVI